MGNGETNEDKTSVKQLFSPSIILDIKQEKIFFGDLLRQFQEIKKGEIN